MEQVRQLETSLSRAEERVSEKEGELSLHARRTDELEADNTRLRIDLTALCTRLEETKVQLNGSRSEKNRLQNELERTRKAAEELKAELKASREQTRKYEDERRRLAEFDQLSRDYRTASKHQRHDATASAFAAVTSHPVPVSARKLFDVQVRHEKSSASCSEVTDWQYYRPAPSRQVIYYNYLLTFYDTMLTG